MVIYGVKRMFGKNIGTIGAGVGGLAVGSVVGYVAGRRSSKRKKSKSRASSSSRKRNNKSRRRTKMRRQKQPYTAKKRKDTSHKRIRYTKNNQPYIILASGKARFIKKKSVKNSRKRRGGRY